MLDEGAGNRDALEVHEALARIGAQFDTEVGPDATFLTLTTLTKFRSEGLALLSDLVTRPRFDPGEFERVRHLRTNRLRQLRDVPSATADRAFATADLRRPSLRAPGDRHDGRARAHDARRRPRFPSPGVSTRRTRC